MDEYFYRLDENGNAVILHCEDGAPVTKIDKGMSYRGIFPIGSSLCVQYDHPEGIVLSVLDAMALGIEEE